MRFKLHEAVAVLSNTPAALKALLGELPDEWTASEENREDWSPFDIVGHLIHAEETDWIPRAEIILEQDAALTFEPFDRFAMFEKSKNKTLSELLETFAERRRQSLEILKSWELTDEQMRLEAMHPDLGRVDLEQLLATWVVHDLTHIRQIVANLAKKYADAVGPWREYLSILK